MYCASQGLHLEEVLTEEEALRLLSHLNIAKRVWRSVTLRELSLKPIRFEQEFIPRLPTRCLNGENLPRLSRLNRSAVDPTLILDLALSHVDHSVRTGNNDARKRRPVVAAENLPPAGKALAQQTVGAAQNPLLDSRQFWERFSAGIYACRRLTAARELIELSGEWAFFTKEQLQVLLPGIVIPPAARRLSYLAILSVARGSLYIEVYSSTGLPLFAHQFNSPALKLVGVDAALTASFQPVLLGALNRA